MTQPPKMRRRKRLDWRPRKQSGGWIAQSLPHAYIMPNNQPLLAYETRSLDWGANPATSTRRPGAI